MQEGHAAYKAVGELAGSLGGAVAAERSMPRCHSWELCAGDGVLGEDGVDGAVQHDVSQGQRCLERGSTPASAWMAIACLPHRQRTPVT